jgi:hypothetical protein
MAVVSGMVVLRHTAAQEPTPVDEHTPFRARVAEHLGITTEELDAAIKQAALDVVAEAEDAGSISNDQADDARERIESGNARRFIGRLQEWRAHRKAVRSAIVDSAAAAIGITPDDLRADLHSGMSIADAADANGASVEDVSARILSDAAAKLTERVADGKIEQAQADEILRRFETRLDDIVNRKKTGPAQ